MKSIVDQVRTQIERIDILITCAGSDIGAAGTDAPMAGKPPQNDPVFIALDDVRTVPERNLMTCILCCREVAPEMMERKTGYSVSTAVMRACSEPAIRPFTRLPRPRCTNTRAAGCNHIGGPTM